MLNLSDCTESIGQRSTDGFHFHMDGMFLYGIERFLLNRKAFEIKNRSDDFEDDKEFMKYLSVNDQHLLLGSQFILKNRDYKMSTDYKTFLNEYKTIYTVAVREGIGRKGSQNLLLGTVYSKNKMKEKSSEFALKERLLIQYADKYYPVKKYAVDLSELTEKKKIEYLSPDKKWFLFLQGVYRDHIERMAQIESFALTQEFCLILTIRDPNQKEHVYDEVTQKLDEYNFWHSNIRVATDVNIPL